MADVTNSNPNDEPSMEEILASIRRIIADEKDPNASEEAPVAIEPVEDVIELTQVVEKDGSITDIAEPTPTFAPTIEPMPAPEPKPSVAEMDDSLVSNVAATAAASSLESLTHSLQSERKINTGATPIGTGGRTLEDMVLELMRPLLKGWLDENLPQIVNQVVQKEVERIARRVQE